MKNDNNFDNTFRIALILIACIFMMCAIIKNLRDTSSLEQETVVLKEQISTLEEQIFDLRSKMPQNQLEVMNEDLPTEIQLIETEPEQEVSRGTERGIPINATVTTYCLEECGKAPDHPEYGITYSGNPVREWYTCAAAPMFPLGTVFYIPYFKDSPSGGIFVVEDRGSAVVDDGRYGPCIDIYLDDYQAVKEFGGKELEVFVLEGVEL